MFEEIEDKFREALARLRGRREATPPGGKIVREVMNPVFLRKQLELVQAAGERDGVARTASFVPYDEAYRELDDASTTPSVPFMPRTPINSMLQSTLTTCFESRVDELLRAAPEGLHRLADAVLADAEIFREFGPCDPLWIETKLAEGCAQLEGKPPFPDSPSEPVQLAEDARLVIVGDWGTGLPGAIKVAQQMRKRLDEASGRARHVIHLGDVYYSGWREEYETRFLPHWPVDRTDPSILSWALNGNHDMYSGGHGYFGYLLRDPRFRGQWRADPAKESPSSHFSLENEHWQILGLDSGYQDHDLAGSQEQWLGEKLAAQRKTMLVSHHQPLSAYESVGQAMTKKVQSALGDRVLDAWLWGHEHRCTVYADNPTSWLRFGSCIGNGGVPQQLPDPPLGTGAPKPEGYAPLSWAYAGDAPADGDNWLRFGFAVIDVAGATLNIEYVDEDGNRLENVTLE